MKSWRPNINGFLCALAIAFLSSGCVGPMIEKQMAKTRTLIYFHLETFQDGNPKNRIVPIYRAEPQYILIEDKPFLDSASVVEAQVVEVEGGFGIRILFDRHGRLALESITSANPQGRIAIGAAFPKFRWLGAPRIGKRVADGIFIFTPDASREETERIVSGINKMAKTIKKRALRP